MKEVLIPIKKATVTNNCPECFNNDLTLTFYQKMTEGAFVKKLTSEVSHTLICNTCHSKIYPVKWTDDIERVFEYYQKMISPKKPKLQFTSMFYILALTAIAIVVALIAYLRFAEII